MSELVTNVVMHAGTSSVLSLSRQDGRLRVAVRDGSVTLLVVVSAGADGLTLGGRGMLLIESLAHRWGSHMDEHGKSVWFEMIVPGKEQWERA